MNVILTDLSDGFYGGMETAQGHLSIGQANSGDKCLVLVRGSQTANVRVDGLGVFQLTLVF